MQFAHFGKSERKEEAFALSASSSPQEWTIGKIKRLYISFLFIDRYRIQLYILFDSIEKWSEARFYRKMKWSKRPFRDSNCRYAFRLATDQTGGGSLFACNAGSSPLVRSRSRGRRLPHTSEKVKKYGWSKKKYIRNEKEKLGYGNRRLGQLL